MKAIVALLGALALPVAIAAPALAGEKDTAGEAKKPANKPATKADEKEKEKAPAAKPGDKPSEGKGEEKPAK